MKRRIRIPVLAASASLALGAALTSQAYIMGRDDRMEPSVQESQLEAVRQTGLIRIPGEDFVTGVATGANCDVVLSAGHAAFHYETSALRGLRRGERRGHGDPVFFSDPLDDSPGISMQLVRSGYEDPDRAGLDEHDWAIFRLSRPAMSPCVELSLHPDGLACDGTVSLPAFHFDRRNALLVDRTCSARPATNPSLLIHDCDTKDGSSGAPLLCLGRQGATLMGINVSGLTVRQYYDPGVYGEAGPSHDEARHTNFAVALRGEFRRALLSELVASRQRRAAGQD